MEHRFLAVSEHLWYNYSDNFCEKVRKWVLLKELCRMHFLLLRQFLW